jgi:hypothetical protein
MGADLIVFIAVGPRKFQKRTIGRVAKRAKRIKEHAKKLITLMDKENADEQMVKDEIDELFKSDLLNGLKGQRMSDTPDEADVYLRAMADMDTKAFVEEFIDWWYSCSGRDSAGRSDPFNKKYEIRVCGEMSWGDTPDGYGYTTMDKAYWFNIPEGLGIC